MSNIEKIRAEIERRITDNTFGAKLELIDILAWLDTLSEEPDKSLEEAAKEYVKDIPTFKDSCLMKAAFEDGWLCSKEQMLKDAVEADVNTYEDLVAGKRWAEFVVRMPTSNLGDKVRIVILKAEEG